MNSFSDRLRLAMDGPPKVSAVALAKACRVQPPAVSCWLNGSVRAVRAPHLIAAAEFLKVHPKWLATGLGPRELGSSDLPEALGRAMRDLTQKQQLTLMKIVQLHLEML